MTDFSIHPVYLSARAAIVAPERAIPLSLYFAQKWLPRLGPERWSLILLLRSMSVDSKRRSDGTKRVTCSWRQISDMLDVHEETVSSWLKHEPIPNDKPWRRIIPADDKAQNLALFIPRLRYAYETRNGKTRRIGFLLEVLMEDPVVEEDETRLQQQMELLQLQQGSLNLDTYRYAESVNNEATELPQISRDLHKQPDSNSRYVNPAQSELLNSDNPAQTDLHNRGVNPTNTDSPPSVKQDYVDQVNYVNQLSSNLPPPKSDESGKNVNELDILIQQLKQKNIKRNIRRDVFEPVIGLTETLLEDNHSTGMLFKVLNSLYPERIDLYLSAVRVAVDAGKADRAANKGAVFVRALRDFADVAGVDLGLKSGDGGSTDKNVQHWNPGSNRQDVSQVSFAAPTEYEAIWAETQAMLRHQMTRATYDAIIQGTKLLEKSGDRYIIGVGSEMAREWLENRLREIVQRALSSVVGGPVTIEFQLL